MLTYFKRLFARFLMCLSLLTATVGSAPVVSAPVVCLSVAILSVGCAPMLTLAEMAEKNPAAHAATICARPAEVGPDVRIWAYNKDSDIIVTDEDRFELLWFAETASSIHEYSPTAPATSAQDMPEHFGLVCPERWSPLANAARVLPDASVILPPCPVVVADLFVAPMDQRKPNSQWLAQTQPETRSPFLQPLRGAAFAPDCATLIREVLKQEAQAKGFNYGQQLGFTLGATEGAMNHLLTAGRGIIAEEFKKDPAFLDNLLLGLAKRLEGLSQPPEYTDPELAGIAQAAFEKGYGKGVAEIQLQFNAVHTGGNVLIVLLPNIIGAVELVGARALRAVLTRMRTLPVFLPSAIGGPGIFLRLPKAAPTPSTAPTFVAPRMPAPASVARAPVGPPPSLPAVKPPPAAPPAANAATTALGGAATRAAPTGQLHHGISKPIHKALEDHKLLKGAFKERDPQFTARAATPEAHDGYAEWHRDLDREIVKYIKSKDDLTPKDFTVWLYKRYKKADLAERFPGGLGANK